MNDETLKQLLNQADTCGDLPAMDSDRLAWSVRRKFRRRKQIRRSAITACAGIVLVAVFYGAYVYQAQQKQQQIARMQQQIQQLMQQTEATLKLVDEVLAQQKKQDELAALNRQLASYADRFQSIQTEVNDGSVCVDVSGGPIDETAGPAKCRD